MARFQRALHGAISSYLALAATTVATLASVPLALHYLSPERFGLWALMTSISGYFNLIDLGMSTSVARLLIDQKDHRENGKYGSMIQTGWLVLICQGLILLVLGLGIAPFLADMLRIETALRAEFILLLRWQVLVWALTFFIRIFHQILYAHQRIDITNYMLAVQALLGLVLLWVFLGLGCGVMSLTWSGLIVWFVGAVFQWTACSRLGLLPLAGGWGRPSRGLFKELFIFGKDMFLIGLGTQLILASQTMIVTARLGLAAAALWSVGVKAYTLIIQVVKKIFDAGSPGFGEMLARGERAILLARYRTTVILSTSIAAFCAVSYALCNDSFVLIWTHKQFAWTAGNDLLLGGCILAGAVAHCHNCLTSLTKDIRFLRYIYFIEGSVFVLLALAGAGRGGLGAIILASLICSLAFTCSYGVSRVRRFFGLSLRELVWEWSQPMLQVLWRFGLVALPLWWLTLHLSAWARFLLHGTVCGTVGLWLLVNYGVPCSVRDEIVSRLPRPASRLASCVMRLPLGSK